MTQPAFKRIHSLVIASSVGMDQETEIPNNLKGTLKDKIHLEDFCYNVQKYRMHKSIQYSEESALKVKIDRTDQTEYDLVTNDFILPLKDQNQNQITKTTPNHKTGNTEQEIKGDLTKEMSDENRQKINEISKKLESEKSFETIINRKFMPVELSQVEMIQNLEILNNEELTIELIYLIKQLNKHDYIPEILNILKRNIDINIRGLENKIQKVFDNLYLEKEYYDLPETSKIKKMAETLAEIVNKLDPNNVFDCQKFFFNFVLQTDLLRLIPYFTNKIDSNNQKNKDIDRSEFVNNNSYNQNKVDQTSLKCSNFSDLIQPKYSSINNTDLNDIQVLNNVDFNNHNQNNNNIDTNANQIIINHKSQTENNEGLNKNDELTGNTKNYKTKNNLIKYYPVNNETTDKIKSTIENKVKRKLKGFFDKCKTNENCILFLSGHGDQNGLNFYLNVTVRSVINFEDILKLWNERKHQGNSHLLIIIDACYLGKWTEELQWNSKYRNITDISIQTSSNQDQTSVDGGAETGGCFLNNFLYLNGMRDLFYNYDYKTTDRATGKLKDGQTPTFFSRFDNLESDFRLKIGFNDWHSMEKRVRKNFKGKFCGENDEYIEGDFKSIQLHGFGVKKLNNGRIESGHFKNDALDGHGKIEWEGMTCEGVFVNGILTGDYKAKLSTGENIPDLSTSFDGFQFNRLMIDSDIIKEIKLLNENPLDNVKYEWIKEINQDLSKIEGECRDNKRHGFNVVYKNKKISQVGIWQHNEFKDGIKINEDGSLQKCSENSIDNYLRVITPNRLDVKENENYYSETIIRPKSLLMDMFFADKFWSMWNKGNAINEHRKADMTFIGSLVSGSKDGLPNGKGTFVQSNGVHYDGHWENGLPHGYGQYHNPSTNEAYSGHWSRGLRDGYGKMVFNNKECYEGNWQSDRAIGWGAFTDSSENTSNGFIVLKDDDLLLEKPIEDRLYGFTGDYHRVIKNSKVFERLMSKFNYSKEIISKTEEELSKYDNQIKLLDDKIELFLNINSVNEEEQIKNSKEIKKLKYDKDSLIRNKDTSEKLLKEFVRIKNLHEKELKTIPLMKLNKFKGSVWNNSIFGLCKFTNNLHERIVVEFCNNDILVRNEVLKNEFSYYEGDVIIDFNFGDYLMDIPKNQLKNKINSKQKHGIGKLIEFSNDCFEEFDGLFHLNNIQGFGKRTVTKFTDSDLVQKLKSDLFNNTEVNHIKIEGIQSDVFNIINNQNDNLIPLKISNYNIANQNNKTIPSVSCNTLVNQNNTEGIKSNIDSTLANQNDKIIPSFIYNNLEDKLMIYRKNYKNNTKKEFYGLFDKDMLISKISVKFSDQSKLTKGFALMEKIKFQSTEISNVYEQNYTNICLYGHGLHQRPKCGTYSGVFYKHKREGFGKLNIPRVLEYEGSFKSNMFWGKGILKDKKKQTEYIGDFFENQKHGVGKLRTELFLLEPEVIKDNDIEREIIVCDSEYSGGFDNDLYSGQGYLVKKYIEKITKGISFKETQLGIITEEFMFNNTDKFIFRMNKSSDDFIAYQSKQSNINENEKLTKVYNNMTNQSNQTNNTHQSKLNEDKIISQLRSSDDNIIGRLKYVIFRQVIEKPVDTDNHSKFFSNHFYFNDYTSVSIEINYELLKIKNRMHHTNSDQLKYLIDKSNWDEKVFRHKGEAINRRLLIDDNLEYIVTIKESNNRSMCRVEKILYQTLECGINSNKKSLMTFSFVRNSNEMYIINVYTNADITECQSIRAEQNLTEVYNGEFHKGEKSGSGELYQFDGSHYQGQFDKNRFHGNGKLKDTFGVYYDGDFKFGKKSGFGKIQWPCNEFYKGLFKNDVENGNGEFIWDFNEFGKVIYTGEFKNGKMNGFGKLTCDNRYFYEGHFKNGYFDGIGQFTASADNKIFKGAFRFNCTFDDISIYDTDLKVHVKGSGAFCPQIFFIMEKHQYKSDIRITDALIVRTDDFYLFDGYKYNNQKIESKDKKMIKLMDFNGMDGKCELKIRDMNPLNVNMTRGAISGYETVILDDQSVYTGEFLIKGRFLQTKETKWTINQYFEFHTLHGYGIRIDSDNNIQLGQFFAGEFTKGIIVNKNVNVNRNVEINKILNVDKNVEIIDTVDIMIGSYKNGLLNGDCEILYANGDIYKGEFKNGKKHGKGLLLTKDMIYCGDFHNDFKQGLGQSITCDNQEYFGEFINNKKSGKGLCYYTDDYSYNGVFENDFPSGYGERTNKYINEHIYGLFESGLINGFAEKTSGINACYTGEYIDSLYDGYGVLKIDNKSYEGHFLKGKYHGYGVYSKPKYTYEGYFEKGLKEGFGKLTYSNGVSCCGMFKNNKLIGKGKWQHGKETKEVEFKDSKVVHHNWSGDTKENWFFTGECWFDPSVENQKNCSPIIYNQFLQKNIEIKFDFQFTFAGDFNYNFYEKPIEFYDCVYLDICLLDIINNKLMMSPQKKHSNENIKCDKKILRDNLIQNKQLIKQNNEDLYNKLFLSIDQNQLDSKLDDAGPPSIDPNHFDSEKFKLFNQLKLTSELTPLHKNSEINSESSLSLTDDMKLDRLMNDFKLTPELKKTKLFYKYFESNSQSFSSLIDQRELNAILNYKGTFKNGMWNEGTITYKNGDKLVGKFKNFKIKKIGIKHFNDGSKYEGEFKDNLLNGYGKLTYSNGITYEGYFKNNKKHYFGKLKISQKLKDIFIQTDDDFILQKVKNRVLDNGFLYNGECLMKLKSDIKVTDNTTFDDCTEYVGITGNGIQYEQFRNKKFESVLENNFKLIEEIKHNNETTLRTENGNSDFTVVKTNYSNGLVFTQIDLEGQKIIKFIKFQNGNWFIGSVIDENRTGQSFMQFNGVRTSLVFFRKDELI